MTAPAPGWHPDPTSRHAYRYWDGWQWTDDVSDGRRAGIDPLPDDEPTAALPRGATRGTALGPGVGVGAGRNGHHDYARERYADERYTGYRGYGDPGGHDDRTSVDRTYVGYGDERYGWEQSDGWESYERYPYAGEWSDDEWGANSAGGGGQRARKGLSIRLLVGLGLVAVALVAGAAFVVLGDSDDPESARGAEISDGHGGESGAGDADDTGSTTASTGTTATTAPPGSGGAPGGGDAPGRSAPPTTAAPGGGGGSGGGDAGGSGGSGGNGGDQELIDSAAAMFLESSGGQMTEEQADCMAQGMYDALGAEGLRAMTGVGGGSGTPPPMSAEDYQSLQTLTVDCGLAG